MGIFNFKKRRDDVVDLGEMYRKQQERSSNIGRDMGIGLSSQTTDTTSSENDVGMGSFFGSMANAGNNSDSGIKNSREEFTYASSTEEKRRKLVKRLMDMTEKIEDLSNQIYHLQQRIELLERKTGIR